MKNGHRNSHVTLPVGSFIINNSPIKRFMKRNRPPKRGILIKLNEYNNYFEVRTMFEKNTPMIMSIIGTLMTIDKRRLQVEE